MSNSRIVPYEDKHLPLLDLKDDDEFTSIVVGDIKDRLALLAKTGNGCVIEYNGVYLGVIGFFALWEGVYEFWAVPCKTIEEYGSIYARIIKIYVERVISDLPGHRYQIVAIADSIHEKWVQFLGFTLEGRLRKFSDRGHDFNMWARVI